MENLAYGAKIAIIRVLTDILKADGIVHEKEVEYLDSVARVLALGDGFLVDVDNLVTLQALATIRELPVEIKEEVAVLMGKMIITDRDINYNEVKLYNTFCESCDIAATFNISDYPEYTLSGEFCI